MKKNPMTPEEFERKMREISDEDENDTESAHRMMDSLMCSLLETLGYSDGVKVFCETYKWYA